MLLERRTVSRKTPGDGKLEVSQITADALSGSGGSVTVECPGGVDTARLVAMTCTCAKGAGGQHEHLFLESGVFRTLEAGTSVDLTLNERRDRLSVTPPR